MQKAKTIITGVTSGAAGLFRSVTGRPQQSDPAREGLLANAFLGDVDPYLNPSAPVDHTQQAPTAAVTLQTAAYEPPSVVMTDLSRQESPSAMLPQSVSRTSSAGSNSSESSHGADYSDSSISRTSSGSPDSGNSPIQS